MNDLSVTSIEKLQSVAGGEVVELPPFLTGEPFVARLRSASLLGLAAAGAIPNPLLSVAEGLFGGKIKEFSAENSHFKEMAEMFNIVAESALAEPAMADLEANNIMLTDMQLLAIFNYTQMGAKALAGFRGKQSGDEGVGADGALPGEAEQTAGT